MATREDRLAEFHQTGWPDPAARVELLCEDHVGTYVLPFACVRLSESWRNAHTGEMIEARVVGWRLLTRRSAGAVSDGA